MDFSICACGRPRGVGIHHSFVSVPGGNGTKGDASSTPPRSPHPSPRWRRHHLQHCSQRRDPPPQSLVTRIRDAKGFWLLVGAATDAQWKGIRGEAGPLHCLSRIPSSDSSLPRGEVDHKHEGEHHGYGEDHHGYGEDRDSQALMREASGRDAAAGGRRHTVAGIVGRA